MSEENKDKDILNYESDYGKEFHERNLLKERTNIYVENLNIEKAAIDNSNYGNNINPTVQGNLDLNMDWSIKSSEPLYNNNGLQLPKSNNNIIKEEEIKNSKIYKDMENDYKEVLNKLNDSKYKLKEVNAKNKKLKKFISEFIDFVLLFIKDKDDQKKITTVMKMYVEDDDNE